MKKMKNKSSMVWSLMILLLFVVGCGGGGGGGGGQEVLCTSGAVCNCVCTSGFNCGPSTCVEPECTIPDDEGIKYCPDEDNICYKGDCYYGFGVSAVTLHCGLAAINDPTSLISPTPGAVGGGIQASQKSGTLREVAPPCVFNCDPASEGVAVITMDCDPATKTNCDVPLIDTSETASENAPMYGAAP